MRGGGFNWSSSSSKKNGGGGGGGGSGGAVVAPTLDGRRTTSKKKGFVVPRRPSSSSPLGSKDDRRRVLFTNTTSNGFIQKEHERRRRRGVPSAASASPSSSSGEVMVFPKQEDEAYPYLSRRRAVDEGQFERRGRQPPRYEQKVRLKDDGVVEYAVIKKIEKTATTTTTTTTTRRNEEEDALSEIYSRMHEGILGGSNTSDDFTRSRKATAKEVLEFALFGSDEAFETRRLKGPPLYQTLDTHRLENFYVCETQSQSAFGKSTMNTFVSSDRSKRFIQFKMIDTNSRVFEVYEGSNAIEIDPYDGSIVLVARGTAKVKGLLKTFAHKQVANALVSKIRTNLEKTCEDINHANNVNNKNNINKNAILA